MIVASTSFNRFEVMRQHVAGLQRNITRSQTEATTGRVADPVSALGTDNARRIALTATAERLSAIVDANGIAVSRLSATQTGLESISGSLEMLSTTLANAVGGVVDRALLHGASSNALQGIKGALNTNSGGIYVLGGIAVDRLPVGDLDAAQLLLENEFQVHFGFPVSSPSVGGISADDLTIFLENVAEHLFTGAAWTGAIAQGSGSPIRARISPGETAVVSLTANENALRVGFVSAFLVSELSKADLNETALSALAARGLAMGSTSSAGVAELQGQAGLIEERLSITNERLLAQSGRFLQSAGTMISVDPFEAASRFSQFVVQLETAYALTGRLQQLSLMRFISP